MLRSGAQLPSTRDLAHHLGVSRRVVVDAYTHRLDVIVDEGSNGCLVQARSYAAFLGSQGAVYRALIVGVAATF